MKIEIPIKMPSLNDYIKACRRNRYAGAAMKKKVEQQIEPYIRQMEPYTEPVEVSFIWVETNQKRDPDNIASAKKFILDAMVRSGKIKDDNRKYIKGFIDRFEEGPETKVIVEIKKEENVK